MTEGIEESGLLRFVEGDCSPDEAAAIQAWIAADPRRGELLDEMRAVWRLTGSSTRRWVVAEARIRPLRSRGRHAAQGSAGFSARPRLLPRAGQRLGIVRIASPRAHDPNVEKLHPLADFKKRFPIPQTQINADPALTQNPGY